MMWSELWWCAQGRWWGETGVGTAALSIGHSSRPGGGGWGGEQTSPEQGQSHRRGKQRKEVPRSVQRQNL